MSIPFRVDIINPEMDIIYLVERLGNLIRATERKAGASIGLQPIQIQILSYLSFSNKYSDTAAAVTDFFDLTKGTVSQSVKILEKRGLIYKIKDPKDGRLVHLSLTDKGKDFLNNYQNKLSLNYVIDDLGKSKSAKLRELLTDTLLLLQKRNENKTFGICNTCHFFRKNAFGENHQCGLTREELIDEDSHKICREHEIVS